MNIQRTMKVASMLTFALLVACSNASEPTLAKNEHSLMNRVVAGSYIVHASGDGEQAIRHVFAEYGVALVRSLGNEQYEMQLNRDPGIDALNSLVAGSDGKVKSIQPNFIYHSN